MTTFTRNARVNDRKIHALAAAVLCALAGLPTAAFATGGTTSGSTGDATTATDAATTAQDGATAEDEGSASDAGQATTLDAVIVTAQKREQAAIEVPASVTALDASRLTKSGATQLEDYSAQVPGMSITSNGGSMQVTLRGISTGLSQAAPTTAIYIDEAPIGSVNSYAVGSGLVPDIDPAELRQIEVLKGPQGTIFGGGAMGGVLRYVTRAPDFEKVGGSVTLGANDVAHGGNGSVARFSLNLPASEDLAFRVSAFRRDDAGFIDNPLGDLYGLPTEDINDVTTTGARVAMAWRLGDAWRVDASYYHQRREADGGTWVDVDRSTLEPIGGDYEHSIVVSEAGSTELDVGNVTVRGPIGGVEFVSSTTWQENDADARSDASQSFGVLLGLLNNFDFTWGVQQHQQVHTRRLSQEFRIEDSAFEDQLYWSAGVYYTDEDSENRIPSFPTISLFTGEPRVVTFPGTAIPVPDGLVKARIDTTYRELSAFANATWTFNETFDLQGGVRFGQDKQTYDQFYSGLLFFPGIGLQQDSDNDKFQWLVSGRYHPTDDSSFYARVATGYRPGGPSAALPIIPYPAVVGPDSLISYEAGWKTVGWDDKLSFEVAVFRTDWEDIIIQTSVDGSQFFVNGGKATSQGWETTLALFPVRGLNLRGTLAYTDATLTEDTDVLVPDGRPLGADGDELPFVPEWTSSVLADYTWPVFGDWSATVGGSVNYIGERITDYSGRDGVDVPSYTQVNAAVSLQNESWQLSLYGKNLNDSDGIIYTLDRGILPTAPFAAGIIRPRTIGLDVTYRF